MSSPSKSTAANVWRALEKTADEVELARIDALDEEALDRELEEAGLNPEEASRVGEGVLEARLPNAHIARATSWLPWLAIAAIVALVLTAFATRREVEAWLHPAPAPMEKTPEREFGPLPPSERAAQIRENAVAACGGARWAECARGLDEAEQLDPPGEQMPLVQAERARIRAELFGDGGEKEWPKPK